MNVVEIRLDVTKNLGNYESKKAGATVAIGEGECVDEAMGVLNSTISNILVGTNMAVKEDVATEPVKKKVTKKKVVKKAPAKKAEVEEIKESTMDEARQAAVKFKKAKKSAEMVKSLIKEITGCDTLKEVKDATLFTKFITAVEARL